MEAPLFSRVTAENIGPAIEHVRMLRDTLSRREDWTEGRPDEVSDRLDAAAVRIGGAVLDCLSAMPFDLERTYRRFFRDKMREAGI